MPTHQADAVHDVVLVGSPIANRPLIVKKLIDAGVNLAIYGSEHWNKYEYARSSYYGYVDTEKFNDTIAQSKIVLALLEDHVNGNLHMNTKIWEAVRVGRLPIVTFYEPLIKDYEFVEGSELVMYHNVPDLINKVIKYTDDVTTRLEVTKNLYNKVFENFNYIDLYEELFNKLVRAKITETTSPVDYTNESVASLLLSKHNATIFGQVNSQVDLAVLELLGIIEKDNKMIDIVYFNRVEKGSQVLQYRPFISLDSVIFLVPVNGKYHMIFILIKSIFNKRALHVKQFCIESRERSFLGFLNNITDAMIYSKLGYRFKGLAYRFDPVKQFIQKVLKF